MGRIALPVGVLAGVLVVSAAAAGGAESGKAAEAAAAFESVWGSELNRVKATRDAADDVDLAGRLLKAARAAADQPELVALLCDQASDLAAAHATGYAVALDALDLEAAMLPDRADRCGEKAAEIRQRQFEAARGEARLDAGEVLIDLLLKMAEAKAAAGALADAAATCKNAQTVARSIDSDRKIEIDARLKALAEVQKTLGEINNLKRQLDKTPPPPQVRDRIVRLWLVDLDNPAEAAKYLPGAEDPALQKYVPAAAKPLADVPELACLELGDWYRDLGDCAAAAPKPAMLGRAITYYNRFLELHRAQDADHTRAAAVVVKLADDLEKLSAKGSTWIELIPLVDPDKDAPVGKWRREGGALVTVDSGRLGRIMLPVVPKGSYELVVRFVRSAGDDTVGLLLPVGSTGACLQLSGWHGRASGLEEIDGKDAASNPTTVRPGSLQNGRQYALAVRVLVRGDQAEIAVTLDGKPYTRWRGSQASLHQRGDLSLPQAGCPGLVGCNARERGVVFRGARLRMLSGEARLVRPAPKPVPAPKL
jgi:hypothetical protein